MSDALTCGHEAIADGIGTGYGSVVKDGKEERYCYACCAERMRAEMCATGKATLYLVAPQNAFAPGVEAEWTISIGSREPRGTMQTMSGDRWRVTDWPGQLSFRCYPRVRSVPVKSFGRSSRMITAYFAGPDGYVWRVVNRGDSQIARCTRTREKAR